MPANGTIVNSGRGGSDAKSGGLPAPTRGNPMSVIRLEIVILDGGPVSPEAMATHVWKNLENCGFHNTTTVIGPSGAEVIEETLNAGVPAYGIWQSHL